MKTISAIAVIGTALLLSACHQETVQSVEWYMAHDQERAAMLEKCKAMTVAQSLADENCAHVDAAIKRADTDAKPWRSMPMSPTSGG